MLTIEQTGALEDELSSSDPKEQAFKCEERGLKDTTRKGGDAIAGKMEIVQSSELPPHDRTGPATTHTGSAGS